MFVCGYHDQHHKDNYSSILCLFFFLRRLQVLGQWERAAAAVGNATLIVRLVQGGTLFYMWSECLFGLVEEVGPLAATVAVAVRPVAVYALAAVSKMLFHLVWFGFGLGLVWFGLVWLGFRFGVMSF